MTELELQQQRAQIWSTNGNPVLTLEDARAFVERVGFCLMYPERSLPLMPTLIGAYVGSSQGLPDQKHAFADPRARQATDLMVRLLRERAAYEASLSGGTGLIIAAQLFPYFYALVSDRNPKAPPRPKTQGMEISPLAVVVFEAIQKQGPMSKGQLREAVGRELSGAALERALGELWAILKITRVDYREDQGAFWDVLYRWAPETVKEGINVSAPEAISALVSKYLEAVVAASQEEIEDFFSSRLTSRSKVRDAINALLAARELSFVVVGSKTLIRLTPAVEEQRRRNHG
jgi:23S rRNA pseudouridine2605 synthase